MKRLISNKKIQILSKLKEYKKKDKKNLSRTEIDNLVILIAEFLNLI